MRHLTILGLVLLASTLPACGGGGGGDSGGPLAGVDDVRHLTTPENTWGSASVIDHPLSNDNPDAVILVTHNWNPGGGGGRFHERYVGVRYHPIEGRWAIVNLDNATMADGLDFNVTIVTGFSSAWTHVAGSGDTSANLTRLAHAEANANPTALLLVTPNLTPRGAPSPTNDGAVGVFWTDGAWHVVKQAIGPTMSPGMAFNVHLLPHDAASNRHQAILANTDRNYTLISHRDANDDPFAHVQATLDLADGVHNNRETGVFYHGGENRWAIYNEDGSAMPLNAKFIVRVK